MIIKILTTLVIVCLGAMVFLPGKDTYVEHTEKYIVAPGGCLDDIAYLGFKKDKRDVVWDAYRHEIRKLNKHLQNSSRVLQPGDEVTIKWYTKNDRT